MKENENGESQKTNEIVIVNNDSQKLPEEFRELEMAKIAAAEKWAIYHCDPVFKGYFRFLFLLFWSCNRIGVDSETVKLYAKKKFLNPLFPDNGFNALHVYCYSDINRFNVLKIDNLKELLPPSTHHALIYAKKIIVLNMRRNEYWNEDSVASTQKSTGVKQNLIRAFFQFQYEQCFYEKWAWSGIEGTSIIVNASMNLYRNVLTDKMFYEGHFEGAERKEMTSAIMWGFLLENHFGYKPHEVEMFIRSKSIREFDPFRNYFEGLQKWDGEDHIAKLASHVKLESEYELDFSEQFKKHLIRCVGCSLGEMVNRFVFVLSGSKQYTGKSSFIQSLIPKQLLPYFSESPMHGNKDDQLKLCESFIINLEELSSLSNRDVNELKAYISAASTNERRPFDRDSKYRRRRANFFASTNKDLFLNDDTGNTRWLVFTVSGFDFNYSKVIDIDKVWAQAYHYFRSGENGLLAKEELMAQEKDNSNYEIRNLEHEFIADHFRTGTQEDGAEFWTNLRILEYYTIKSEKSVKLNPITLGKAMKQLGFIPDRITKNGQTQRGWWLIKEGIDYQPGKNFILPKEIFEDRNGLFDEL